MVGHLPKTKNILKDDIYLLYILTQDYQIFKILVLNPHKQVIIVHIEAQQFWWSDFLAEIYVKQNILNQNDFYSSPPPFILLT